MLTSEALTEMPAMPVYADEDSELRKAIIEAAGGEADPDKALAALAKTDQGRGRLQSLLKQSQRFSDRLIAGELAELTKRIQKLESEVRSGPLLAARRRGQPLNSGAVHTIDCAAITFTVHCHVPISEIHGSTTPAAKPFAPRVLRYDAPCNKVHAVDSEMLMTGKQTQLDDAVIYHDDFMYSFHVYRSVQ
jgi:hypothetical protein